MEPVQLSNYMEDDFKDFDEKFSEIIESDDLKKISDTFKRESLLTYKDLVLVQQTLLESLSHISDIMFYRFLGHNDIVDFPDQNQNSILSAMYKIAIDFNEIMIEYMFDDFDDDDEEDLDE